MSTLNDEILREALAHLGGWLGDQHGIQRTLAIDDCEHAELTERVKVVSDAMRLRPRIQRIDGHTHISLAPADGDRLTTAQVALAARIEATYHTIAGANDTETPPIRPVARPWLRWRRHGHRGAGPLPDQAG